VKYRKFFNIKLYFLMNRSEGLLNKFLEKNVSS
jgi:hypothetical protein